MGITNIEWTDRSWNPVVGCIKVSAGCAHCYAETMGKRLKAMAVADVAAGKNPGRKRHYIDAIDDKGRWSGKLIPVPEALGDPLSWKKPSRVFVNSMSDLFHEDVPDWFIDDVFASMALAPQHTFQVLTKRAGRMRAYFDALAARVQEWDGGEGETEEFLMESVADRETETIVGLKAIEWLSFYNARNLGWPLPNVELGVSVEDQSTANERIPHLLRSPAALRFVSYEPALGPVDWTWIEAANGWVIDALRGEWSRRADAGIDEPSAEECHNGGPRLDAIIIGGESGHGARPFDLAWARSTIAQCKAAGVAPFLKQFGSNAVAWDQYADGLGGITGGGGHLPWLTYDPKGGDPSEWPDDLRGFREWPAKGGA